MLTWIMFLKLLDDMEQIAEQEAKMAGKRFRPALEPPYRWRDWAAKPDGVTGDELISFVNKKTLKMMRHQIAKAGQVILSEIWERKAPLALFLLKVKEHFAPAIFFYLTLIQTKSIEGGHKRSSRPAICKDSWTLKQKEQLVTLPFDRRPY
jgi:hypothetical protein